MQAVVNNFLPLLFVQLQRELSVPLSKITLLITFNFLIQLTVDLISPMFIDKIGYRASMLISNGSCIIGFLMLTMLPQLFADPFYGILISVCIYAVGGGLQEVLVSPIVEACPTENKETAMSLLHSFYCWGFVGVVLISTLFFSVFGIGKWRILAVLWCLVPLLDFILFLFVPVNSLNEEGEKGAGIMDLLRMKLFWIMLLMMFCGAASEQTIAQWVSAFAERGLGVSKTVGDLLGPMLFAVCQGSSRAIYGVRGEKMDLQRFMWFSVLLCIAGYLAAALFPNPVLALLSCAVSGFAVGIFWPGTFSLASAGIRGGGTLLFAMLAFAGDIGCSLGPTMAGTVAAAHGDNIRTGILTAVLFPVLMGAGLIMVDRITGFKIRVRKMEVEKEWKEANEK